PTITRLYPVRRVSQRLSGVSPDRRARVRVGLSRSYRGGVEPPTVRIGALGRPPLRLESVRGLPGRLPRQDRHPGAAPAPARRGGRAACRRAPPARAASVLDLRRRDGATAPVRVADARRPFLAHHAVAGRVDQVARPPAPRTAELSRAVARRVARSARP